MRFLGEIRPIRFRQRGGIALLFTAGCNLIGGADEFRDAENEVDQTTTSSTGGATTSATGGATDDGGGSPSEGGGGAESSGGSSSTGSTTPECVSGCWDGATCRSGQEVAHCGVDGDACQSCEDQNPCTVNRCVEGACEIEPADGPCAGGVCQDGTCVALQEDCSNGVDDNDDGLIDCSDPVCSGIGYRCVPRPTLGWEGPAAFHNAGEAVACSGAFDEELSTGNTGLVPGPATCSTCSCTASATACPAATLRLFRADPAVGCTTTCQKDVSLAPGACVNLEHAQDECNSGSAVSYAGQSTIGAWSGTCTPSAQVPMLPPPVWQSSSVLCGAPVGGGCGVTEVCSPPPPPSFQAGACIGSSGDAVCPASYPVRTVVYEDVDDNRSCSSCSCAANDCSGTVGLFDGNNCASDHREATIDAPTPDACVEFADDHPRAQYVVDPGPRCTASPSQPTGTITPASPFTICCTP